MKISVKQYQLIDPRHDANHICESAKDMIDIAEAAGAVRFQAITTKGAVLQVNKDESGRWVRDDGQVLSEQTPKSSSVDAKKLYSTIDITAKGYINEIVEQPVNGSKEPLIFVRCSLFMGEDGAGKKRYLSVSVLAGKKIKPFTQRLLDSQIFDQDRAQHTLSGLIVDLSFNSVLIEPYGTESSIGVNFTGVLSDIVV